MTEVEAYRVYHLHVSVGCDEIPRCDREAGLLSPIGKQLYDAWQAAAANERAALAPPPPAAPKRRKRSPQRAQS